MLKQTVTVRIKHQITSLESHPVTQSRDKRRQLNCNKNYITRSKLKATSHRQCACAPKESPTTDRRTIHDREFRESGGT